MTAIRRPLAESTSRLLPLAVRESLVAVVVDANAYGPVGPDLTGLADLARDLAAIGIRTWVPEPVAWEWAEHLCQQWATICETVRSPARHLRKAGLGFAVTIEPHYSDRDDLINAFLESLRMTPHVEVIPLTGSSALEGLRDQILQRPPSRTKSVPPVKTGASDSAWLRDVLAKAGDRREQLIYLSSDRDIERAYAQWGLASPLLRNLGNIRESLFDGVPIGLHDTWLVVQYIVERLSGPLTTPDEGLLTVPDGLLPALGLANVKDGVATAHLTRFTALAGLGPVMRTQPQVSSSDGSDTDSGVNTYVLTANAFFLVDAEATVLTQSSEAGALTTLSTATNRQLVLKAHLVFEAHDRNIRNMRADSVELVPDLPASDHLDGALQELGHVLANVPGLMLPADWPSWNVGTNHRIAINGTNQTLDLNWLEKDWNGLSLRLEDEEVLAPWKPSAVSYIGERGGPRTDLPFPLAWEEIGGQFVGTFWEIPAWIIYRLVESTLRTVPNEEGPPF